MNGCSIAAVVVTYNRKELLCKCLQALLDQTTSIATIFVIDNASTDGTKELLQEQGFLDQPTVNYQCLEENVGGAGGFHAGIQAAFTAGHDWIWPMDDDALPHLDVLEQMLVHDEAGDVLVPAQRHETGKFYGVGYWRNRHIGADIAKMDGPTQVDVFHFVGPLIKRHVVENIGLPNASFFIWHDDIDYSLRISRQGFKIICIPNAMIDHSMGKAHEVSFMGLKKLQYSYSPQKIYYRTRNYLYMITRPEIRPLEILWYLYSEAKILGNTLLFEKGQRLAYLSMILKGFFDGARGKLGRTF